LKRGGDMTRRKFLGTTLVAGAAGACATTVRPLAMERRSSAQTANIEAARTHYQAARAATENATEASAPAAASPPEDMIVDVHCHAFNALDIPIDGFIRSLAQGMGVPAIFDGALAEITRPFHKALVNATPKDGAGAISCAVALPAASAALQTALDALGTWLTKINQPGLAKVEETLKNLLKTLQTVAQPREVVAARLSCTYPEVDLFTPALVDFDFWTDRFKQGEVVPTKTSPIDQITAHAEVSRKSMHGQIGETRAAFHPYAAFNPWRYIIEGGLLSDKDKQSKGITTTLDHIKTAVRTQGFVGVKIYPPCGFVPYGNAHLREFSAGFGQQLDDALDALYTWCVDEDVPILTHASDGNSFYPDSAWRAAPWGWKHALEKHPNLRVCFGHFGHLNGIDGTSDPVSCLAWGEGFLDLMRKYPNVYGDISDSDAGKANAQDRADYQSRFLYWLCGRLADKDSAVLSQRLLYGSDWWMGVVDGMDVGFLKQIQSLVADGMKPYTGGHPPDGAQFAPRFWSENALRFLGIWDNDGKLRKDGTAKRLTDRYNKEGVPLPRWLRAPGPG
jgi:predicted TIM-barrel fold metal-dependent hydrolase